MNRKLLAIVLAGFVIVLANIACSKSAPTDRPRLVLEFSPTPTLVPTQPTKVLATQTPIIEIVEITSTPLPTSANTSELCVIADEAVYLRPSPSATYYPLDPLPKDSRVIFTGTKDGNWLFVDYGDQSGWINGKYLGNCQD
jgi:hypothetical protein